MISAKAGMKAASQRSGVFTPLVLQMIMVGEESGSLGEMLDEIGMPNVSVEQQES